MTERIDSHHHLWQYTASEYGWINDSMQSIQRDFLPDDLDAALRSANIDGAVTVQTQHSLEETNWLLSLAEQSSLIKGVVGWADLASTAFEEQLSVLRRRPKLRGLRHIIQGEPDDNFILRADFNHGITRLLPTGLVYDVLIFERHLPQAIKFVDRHPSQVFVVDHVAKPRIKESQLEPWARNIRALAERENVFCKVSGMVTEADWSNWTEGDLRPYWEIVLESFGPQRLMFGSDWPVCLVASAYAQWVEVVQHWTSEFSTTERDRLFGGTASEVYGLS